jgi:hypothetical protein
MRLLTLFVLSVSLFLVGCTPSLINVELAVLPTTNATAKITQLAGSGSNQNPASCTIPCTVKIDEDSKYEVLFDAPGYYPALVQFDYRMALVTAIAIGPFRERRTPLIIPLVQRKPVKDKSENSN